MQIALVHYSASPIIGGVETVLDAHARLFRAAGHEVTVICGRGQGDVVLPELAQAATPAAEVAAALRPILARQNAIFLHNVLTMPFHHGLTEALWILAAELPGPRWIGWVHDLAVGNIDYAHLCWSADQEKRLSAAHPNIAYVTVSEPRRAQFSALTGHPAPIIPNGLDPVSFLGLTPVLRDFCLAHRLLERDLVLLHPSRLLARKNAELSLRVLGELRAQGTDAVLLLTAAVDPHNPAAAAYAHQLQELRHQLGLDDHAFFLNELFPVTQPVLVGLFALADALFFPSLQEGFGLPILEGALHRLPVFCADRMPMNQLLDHRLTGLDLNAPPAQLAGLVLAQLDACPATQSRKEVIRRYSWDAIFTHHLNALLPSRL